MMMFDRDTTTVQKPVFNHSSAILASAGTLLYSSSLRLYLTDIVMGIPILPNYRQEKTWPGYNEKSSADARVQDRINE